MVDQKITRIKSRPENNNERLFRNGFNPAPKTDPQILCRFSHFTRKPILSLYLRLPLAFVTTEVLRAAYEWRMAGKAPNIIKTASSIKASSNIFVLSKKYSFASSIVQLWIGSYFAPGSQT